MSDRIKEIKKEFGDCDFLRATLNEWTVEAIQYMLDRLYCCEVSHKIPLCTCLTKTPDPKYHKHTCPVRMSAKIKKLRMIIDEGLGPEDLKNDITYPPY